MTPGCYANIPLSAYHAAPGLSKSGLDLIARSPAHWKYGERITTPAMRLGAAVHAAVLEPDQWERRYVRATGRRKADLDAELNRTVLRADEWETCQRIRDAVWRHPTCHDLFRDGQTEGSAWWLDPETRLLCKCRPDWSRPGLLLDLQTASDASPAGFARAVERYRYHVQAAYALDGWPQAGGGAVDLFLFIVVEKAPPYAVALYDLSAAYLDTARALYRRDLACQRLAETQPMEPLPCLVLTDTDDATALEASLAENLERLPMAPFDQYEAFARLLEQGRTIATITAHFDLTERLIQQRLALANLIDPIKRVARNERIPIGTLQTLTLATPKQQRDWWKLYKSQDPYASECRSLKDWLLGGATIATRNALFPLDPYPGQVIADLFGEDRYFADAFWTCQRQAIAERRETLLAKGWMQVEVLKPSQPWFSWEHERVAKQDGGWVFVEVHASGDVRFHEGYQPLSERRRVAADENAATLDATSADPPGRCELTQALQSYVALHKQAAVRLHLAQSLALALRLAVAFLLTVTGGDRRGLPGDSRLSVSDCLAVVPGLSARSVRAGVACVTLWCDR